MPGMCEKKCGECGRCIAHQAQGVIDEKNAEISKLHAQVEENRLGFKVCKVALGDVAKERDNALLQVRDLRHHLIQVVKTSGKVHPSAKHHPVGDKAWNKSVMAYSAARDYLGPLYKTNDTSICEWCRKILTDYDNGDRSSSTSDHMKVESHLTDCAECTKHREAEVALNSRNSSDKRKDWHCSKCGNRMQFKDGMCMDCYGGDPGD